MSATFFHPGVAPRSGFVAAGALVMMLIIIGLGSTLALATRTQLEKSTGLRTGVSARYLAMGGYEVARGSLPTTLEDQPAYSNTLTVANVFRVVAQRVGTAQSIAGASAEASVPPRFYGDAAVADAACLTGAATADCNYNAVTRYNAASLYLFDKVGVGAQTYDGLLSLRIRDVTEVPCTGAYTSSIFWKVYDRIDPVSVTGQICFVAGVGHAQLTSASFSGVTWTDFPYPILAFTMGTSDQSVERLLWRALSTDTSLPLPNPDLTIESSATVGDRSSRVYSRERIGGINPIFIYSVIGQ